MPMETVERGFIHRSWPDRGGPGVPAGFRVGDGQQVNHN